MTTRRRGAIGLVLALALVLSGCNLSLPFSLGFGTGADGRFDGSEVTVPVLYAGATAGGVTSQRITASSAEDAGLSIDITENDVSGVDPVTQASTWTAVTAATLLTGARADTAYTFGFDARIATPAAGAITTVGVLALYYDTEIQPGVALTGTVSPLGTIGPVDGLPEQISAAIEAGGIDTVLVPVGQRSVPDATGTTVDLDQLAATGGMTVVEVADVASAYAVVTGEDLPETVFPTPPPSPTALPTVDPGGAADGADGAGPDDGETAGDALGALADDLLERYAAASGNLPIEGPGTALAGRAESDAARGAALRASGDDGGAIAALASAVDLEAAAVAIGGQAAAAGSTNTDGTGSAGTGSGGTGSGGTGSDDTNSSRTGSDGTIAEAADTANDSAALLQQLIAAPPTTLDDADALLHTYSSAVEAFALARYAQTALAGTESDLRAAGGTAAAMAASALDTARGLAAIRPADGNGSLADGADLTGVASLLRRAAIATADGVDAAVISPRADANAASDDVAAAQLAATDPDLLRLIALAGARDEIAALATTDDGGWSALGLAVPMYVLSIPALDAVRPARPTSSSEEAEAADDAAQQRAAVADEYTVRAVDALRATGANVALAAGSLSDALARTANPSGAAAGESAADARARTDDTSAAYAPAFIFARVLAVAGGVERS